jgi:hypothetical protein
VLSSSTTSHFNTLLNSTRQTRFPGFNAAYELDGTHMNPTYLPLLEKAMNATLGAQ